MNIHFTDKNLFENLKNATLAKVRIGSHLYGTNNENSDIDYLYIYATSQNELNSFIWTNHQLQYKEDGIDHNFVSLHSFIRNIINGDSTINFKIVHSDELKGTCLEFLHTVRNSFNTYTMIRSYLGFARRDLKHIGKCNTTAEKLKKLEHIVRCSTFASHLMSVNDFPNKSIDFKFICDLLKVFIKEYSTETDLNSRISFWSKSIDNDRIKLTAKHDNKTLGLAKLMNVEDGRLLNAMLLSIVGTDIFTEKQNILNNFDMSLFINAFENWVEY